MRTPRSLLLTLAFLLLATAAGNAATRLVYPSGGQPVELFWRKAAFPIAYSIDARLVQQYSNGAAQVERAFNAWTTIPDTNVSFQRSQDVHGARLERDGRNAIMLADDLFKDQQIIAQTVNWWNTDTGELLEGDIQIDASLMTSDYNVQRALQHEVGHLLGLDHTGVISAVMYPFCGKGSFTALDSDDKVGITALYPDVDEPTVGATLKGRVSGTNGGIFAAQVVAMNDAGEPVATALTDATGEFTMAGVPTGSYRFYAEPLDGPVAPTNLAPFWRSINAATFKTQFADIAGPMRVEAGKIYGNVNVNSPGGPVLLNPKWIAVSPEGSRDFALSAMGGTVRPGQIVSIAVAGDGFNSMTEFEMLNPGIEQTSRFQYAANYAWATFRVANDAPTGSVVILVKSGNETATLTGALRIEPFDRRRAIASR